MFTYSIVFFQYADKAREHLEEASLQFSLLMKLVRKELCVEILLRISQRHYWHHRLRGKRLLGTVFKG